MADVIVVVVVYKVVDLGFQDSSLFPHVLAILNWGDDNPMS